jgi:hypothetical protein
MDSELAGAACAGLICVGMWALMAAGTGALAHTRMRRVEAALGRRALPTDERALLFYAGSSVVWLSALVLAAVGLFRRDWARLGRNCFFLFLGHMSLAVLAAIASMLSDAVGGAGPQPLPIVVTACVIVAASASAAVSFMFRWAALRATRIEASGPAEGDPPGAERWAIYVGSALFWPVGLVAALIYGKPENVRVGATALRIMLLHVLAIALAVCVALPIGVALAG